MSTAAKPTSTHAAPHPLAGNQMTCADMIVQVLADEGVDTIFGYSGGAILPTYDAIFRYNESHAEQDEIRLDRAGDRAGRGLHGRRLRALERPRRRVRSSPRGRARPTR